MLIRLYIDPACPHCQRGIAFLTGLGRTFVVRDVVSDLAARRELVLSMGRTDVPVLMAGYYAGLGFDEQNWLKVLAQGDEAALNDPLALPEELGPDPTPI